MKIEMIAEMTGYSKKTFLLWPDFGILRWFKHAYKYYAPKELVQLHLQSEAFRGIANKSKVH